MDSLQLLCIKKISDSKFYYLNEKLNEVCYHKLVNYQMERGFGNWNEQMKLLKVELNIEDIQVSYDMHFDEPCYFIFVKFKGDEEDDYEVFRDRIDSPLYDLYLKIADKKGLLSEYE